MANQRNKPKDTRKGDRHKQGYMTAYMRKYRAKLKAQSYLSPKPLKP